MILEASQPFKLDVTWLQGQAFRWEQHGDWCYGVVHDSLIKVREHDDGIGIEFRSDAPEESLAPHVADYFQLCQDITPVQEALRGVDNTMANLVDKYDGLRILRQDPWECLVSYVCSRRMRVELTAGMIDKVARPFGRQLTLEGMGGDPLYAIPSPARVAEAKKAERKKWNLGLRREDLIHRVATDIVCGRLDLKSLRQSSHDEARERLMKYTGIGWKIADCVCLFALDKQKAFPIDRNIAKALAAYYKKTAIVGAKNAGLMEWAAGTFGANAGYAGQLLFFEGRSKDHR